MADSPRSTEGALPSEAPRTAGSLPSPAMAVSAPTTARGVSPARVMVVATHNQLPDAAENLTLLSAPESRAAASYRMLYYRLKGLGNPCAVAITSPNSGEGKTLCSVNLALAMAEDGRDKVLLVEANLRSPRIAEVLGYSPPACFRNQLARYLETPGEPWRVVAAFLDNLHVLAVDPGGTGPRLLSAPSFRAALHDFRTTGYSHVVIDCPSVIGSADANVVADTVDAVLLTASARRTRGNALKKAKEQLAPCPLLGTILVTGRP